MKTKKYIKPTTRRASMEPNMLLSASLGNGTTPTGSNIGDATGASSKWAD